MNRDTLCGVAEAVEDPPESLDDTSSSGSVSAPNSFPLGSMDIEGAIGTRKSHRRGSRATTSAVEAHETVVTATVGTEWQQSGGRGGGGGGSVAESYAALRGC